MDGAIFENQRMAFAGHFADRTPGSPFTANGNLITN